MKRDLSQFKAFVRTLSVPELVVLQHDLRKHEEDKDYLSIVMDETKSRDKENQNKGEQIEDVSH